MGTPSTVSTVGNQSWYYVSQTTSQQFAFQKPEVIDQRVSAIYFTPNLRVERVADYGLEDGKIFDFISRTTPTGGEEPAASSEICSAAWSASIRCVDPQRAAVAGRLHPVSPQSIFGS